MSKTLIPNEKNKAQAQMLKTRTPSYVATGVNAKSLKPPGGGSARAKAADAMLKANTQ